MEILNITGTLLTKAQTESDSATTSVFGFILLVVYVLGSGSCLVPVKKVETGDGMFFQLVFSMGLWFVALIVNLVRDSPKFYWHSMIGGFLFTCEYTLIYYTFGFSLIQKVFF